MNEFDGVIPTLRDAMISRDYNSMTPVQKAVLVPELGNRDLLVSAQTGSGKTVAFGLAISETLLGDNESFSKATSPLALIVAPTRELALQIKRELNWLYAKTGATIGSCVGGMDMRMERRLLEKGTHIVVGTPGRLKDHIQRCSLNIADINAIVLDEADEMLDLGFREDLEFILAATPDNRRTLLFSATVSSEIAQLARRYQREAVRISTAADKEQHSDIEYRALVTSPSDRENAIVNILRFYEAQNSIIFCATRATVNHITSRFRNRGFSVVALSGELTQTERSHALQAMRDGRARICVATDVAARGIDLPNLELVIHADLPTNTETLLHRSGRTGRAGRKGVSIVVVPRNKHRVAERLLSNTKISATWGRPPSAQEVMERDNARLLAHKSFEKDPLNIDDDLIKQLMSKYSAEQIARAFVSTVRQGQSSPEELHEVDLPEKRSRRLRENFVRSVWFSLSVGRKHNAEPGWLLPLLCKIGQLSRSDIGAIRIQQDETFVEIDATSADTFFTNLGPSKTLQKNIQVRRLLSVPDFIRDKPRRRNISETSRNISKRKPRSETKSSAETLNDKSLSVKPSPTKRNSKPRKIKRKPDYVASVALAK
ncbi:MAG: DEAD/DEAH box helicase [Hyphomicrobiaceae bacterium]|nr:DEAD/DEAH box helicase [Hyphomicrobiaceae bacterium]